MSEIKTMTRSTLDKHAHHEIPADCLLCKRTIIEGQVYLGGGLGLTCGDCALIRARQRVVDAEIILAAERQELAALEAAARVSTGDDGGEGE